MALFIKVKVGDGIFVGGNHVEFDHFSDGVAHLIVQTGDNEKRLYMRPQNRAFWFHNGTRMCVDDYIRGELKLRFDAPDDVKIDREEREEI